jgi:hypothetical protein
MREKIEIEFLCSSIIYYLNDCTYSISAPSFKKFIPFLKRAALKGGDNVNLINSTRKLIISKDEKGIELLLRKYYISIDDYLLIRSLIKEVNSKSQFIKRCNIVLNQSSIRNLKWLYKLIECISRHEIDNEQLGIENEINFILNEIINYENHIYNWLIKNIDEFAMLNSIPFETGFNYNMQEDNDTTRIQNNNYITHSVPESEIMNALKKGDADKFGF